MGILNSGHQIHLMGIGGSGMSSLAQVLLQMGKRVTGCDLRTNEAVRQLIRLGALVQLGHSPGHLEGVDLVIHSTAIDPRHEELESARARGIPVLHRSQALAELMNERVGIAVAGAHGKTTVTAMLALVLEWSGQDPTILIGGELAELQGGAKYGQGPYLVAEADESDGSFLRYRPHIALITSVEADHLEFYGGSWDRLKETYARFVDNIHPDGALILRVDEEGTRQLRRRAGSRRVITYGLDPSAQYTCRDVQLKAGEASCLVLKDKEPLGTLKLQVPGRHNLLNALGVIGAAAECGLAFPEIARHLANFRGVGRRFQPIAQVDDILIFDDYAHHPTEIAVTLGAAREGWERRIVTVFQPHRYSRTSFFWDDFGPALKEADVIVLVPIYSPLSEKPIPQVTSEALARHIAGQTGKQVLYFALEELAAGLAPHLQPGDLVITLGAGDVRRAGEELAALLRERSDAG